MDSYNFHFERMSNIDLHPLSLPMSRLSPAKSNSSIVDQFAHHHHQHGKGDSAYSSFSGGSTAPDYPSPFLPDDLQSSSFSHYADLKYVKSLYNPSQVLQSDPKTMDQLYRSVEAISKQYHHSNNHINHYNGGETDYANNKVQAKQEMASPSSYISHNPPPIPARLDSFIATKNLENTFGHQQETQSQQPQPQTPRQNLQHFEKSDLKTEAYNSRRSTQQQPPSYHLHQLPKDQPITQTNLEYFAVNANNKIEQQKIGKCLSQSPPKSEHLKPKHPPSSHVDPHIKNGQNCLENNRRRAHSANDWLGSDSNREYRSWSAGQSVINSSIQHKGQFYFVTGVCKTNEDSEMRLHASSVCVSEIGSELESYKLRERCHSTAENLFRPLQQGPLNRDERGFVSVTKCNNVVNFCQNEENQRQSLSKSSRSLEALEEIDLGQSRDMGRHTPNNPIFYCGPERKSPSQTKEVTNLSNEQPKHVREEQAKRVNRQSLGDVASERINKETTPLLYQLTGANRLKTEAKPGHLEVINEPQMEASNSQSMDPACNTLDTSYKKFYREQLKDVQSRVLRETSFKRRDLQLSWLHRVRENQDTRPAIVHTFTSSQDSEASVETLTPSVTSEETEKGSIKEEIEIESPPRQEIDKENGRPTNVAQPQVARIGARKRLTQEQKKMCFSEPEKLNQLGGGVPSHAPCRSFGNESENALNVEQGVDDNLEQCEPGLVAARRKMFETRGRAMSASSASKTSLKHLQHKALVEYMERKTGQKVAEPQQAAPQQPAPTRQRHSLGEKPFDWGPRPQSGLQERNQESKKKKLNRPHSAGRILDSSTSSIRYAQFFSSQSTSGQSSGQPYQSKWRESRGPTQGKSASVEDLLDQPENRNLYRNRSTSTPHPFQAFESVPDSLLVNNTIETHSPHKDHTESIPVKAEGQQPVRVAYRGKSMEELGATKLSQPKALSKSTEQLDQIWRTSPAPEPERYKLISPVAKNAQEFTNQETEKIKMSVAPDVVKDISQLRGAPKQKRSPVKQKSEPILGSKSDNQDPSNTSPGSSASPRGRIHSHEAVPSESMPTSRAPNEACSNPPSPRGQDPRSSPTQTKTSSDKRHSPRARSSPSTSEVEESVDEPTIAPTPPDSNQEVSLSCGVTTDPALWLQNPDQDPKQDVPNPALTDEFNKDPPNSPPGSQTGDLSVSPSTSLSDLDINQQTNDDKTNQNPDLEERGTPEGETEREDTPNEKPQWEELVVAVVKSDQSLARVLYPLANRKTALMLMEQLLSEDTLLMEEHYKKKQEQRGGASESVEVVEIEAFSCPSSQCLDTQSKADVKEKKRLLVSYVEDRLRSLDDTRVTLQTDIEENVVRGEALQGLVKERCLPLELERYNLFIGDLERVVSLLLCLSSRLARVQNALSTVDQHTDAEEKQSLDSRHRLLCKQRDDAKDLKDNLDRRESQVQAFLSRQLSPEQLQDYRRFVQTKASLLIRQKDLDERQRLGEEQLEALGSSL